MAPRQLHCASDEAHDSSRSKIQLETGHIDILDLECCAWCGLSLYHNAALTGVSNKNETFVL